MGTEHLFMNDIDIPVPYYLCIHGIIHLLMSNYTIYDTSDLVSKINSNQTTSKFKNILTTEEN